MRVKRGDYLIAKTVNIDILEDYLRSWDFEYELFQVVPIPCGLHQAHSVLVILKRQQTKTVLIPLEEEQGSDEMPTHEG